MSIRHSARLGLTLLAALASLSCRDTTAPEMQKPKMIIGLSLSGVPRTQELELASGLSLNCIADVVASVSGPGVATWTSGVVRFYFGANRAVASDSGTLTLADIRNAWGDSLTSGSRSVAQWTFTTSAPAEFEFELRATSTTSTVSGPARTRFACGPLPPAAPVAAPTVTSLVVTPLQGEVQSGDTIHVKYDASAAGGLWSTLVKLSGPFTAQRQPAEHGALSTIRSYDFVVPPTVLMGVPITVTALAIDAGVQVGTRVVNTGLTVVDRTPPVLRSASLVNRPGGALAGQYAVGDTLSIAMDASDNSAVRTYVWKLTGPATASDSIVLASPAPNPLTIMPIVVRPDWVGSPVFSFYARDAAGLTSNVITTRQDSIRVFPVVTRIATAPVRMPSTTNALGLASTLVYDSRRNVVYIGVQRAPEIAVLDVATMTYGSPIRLSAPASSFDLTTDGDSLIAAIPTTRSLAVISLATPGAPARVIPLTALDSAGSLYPGSRPEPSVISVAANGNALIVLSSVTTSGDRYLTADTRTGAQKLRVDIRGTSPYTPFDMRASPDRASVVLPDGGCTRVYTSSSDTFSGCSPLSANYGQWARLSFDASGRRFAYGNSVYDLSAKQLAQGDRNKFGIVPTAVISPDGATAYLGIGSTIMTMRVADGRVLDQFAIPLSMTRLLVSPGGQWLVAFSDADLTATRVDLR